jgi:hypothetical protein
MFIIVYDNGEKWELTANTLVVEVTDEQFASLEKGKTPSDLQLHGEQTSKVVRDAAAFRTLAAGARALMGILLPEKGK